MSLSMYFTPKGVYDRRSAPYRAAVEIYCHVSIIRTNHRIAKRKSIISGTIKAASTRACPLDCLTNFKQNIIFWFFFWFKYKRMAGVYKNITYLSIFPTIIIMNSKNMTIRRYENSPRKSLKRGHKANRFKYYNTAAQQTY